MTSDSDRRRLLGVARHAIVAHAQGRGPGQVSAKGELERRGAVFVSLHCRGELRGCIGHLESDAALWRVVADCARAASSDDPRFPAVTEDEIAELEIEISILGEFEPVRSLDEIEIGRHGLLVEQRDHRGLLLPQVATEWGWTPRTFVEQTCRKAGLPDDGWQRGATLWRFEAEVFGERAPRADSLS